jgi:Rha family phage regulatory protein
MRDVRDLLRDAPGCACNFALTSVSVSQPNGGTREEPAYNMTRDGFLLLGMGFRGAKALRWKLQYIEAFNKMEATLRAGSAFDINDPAALRAALLGYTEQVLELRQENEPPSVPVRSRLRS